MKADTPTFWSLIIWQIFTNCICTPDNKNNTYIYSITHKKLYPLFVYLHEFPFCSTLQNNLSKWINHYEISYTQANWYVSFEGKNSEIHSNWSNHVQCFTSFFGSSLYNRRQICSNMGTATSVLTGLGETSGAKIHCQRCIWAALMSSKPNKQIINKMIQQITQSCSSQRLRAKLLFMNFCIYDSPLY